MGNIFIAIRRKDVQMRMRYVESCDEHPHASTPRRVLDGFRDTLRCQKECTGVRLRHVLKFIHLDFRHDEHVSECDGMDI